MKSSDLLKLLHLGFLILFFISERSNAESKAELKPILETVVRTRRPKLFETLIEDPISNPVRRGVQKSGNTLLRNLDQVSSLPNSDTGWAMGGIGPRPAGGRSSDEMAVSTLGIPLALPQGNSADFSQWPSFLWSKSQFQSSPTFVGSNGLGVSGSLNLEPWTLNALQEATSKNQKQQRIFSHFSRLGSFAGAGIQHGDGAILAGGLWGGQSGVAGSASQALYRNANLDFEFHAIGSSVEGISPGSLSSPTPNAMKRTWRFLPVLAASLQPDESSLKIFMNASGDFSSLHFDDPTSPLQNSLTRTSSQAVAVGISFVEWSGFLEARRTFFYSETFPFVLEAPLRSYLGYRNHLGSWIVEQQIQMESIVGKISPALGAKLGAALPMDFADGELKIYGRFEELPKLPSISARYYQMPLWGILANPSLKPERVHRVRTGIDFKNDLQQQKLEFRAERRNQIHQWTGTTTQNLGNALIYGLDHQALVTAPKWASFSHILGLNFGRLDNGSEIAYLPRWSERFRISSEFRELFVLPFLEGQWASASSAGSALRNSGYFLWNTGIQSSFGDFDFVLSVENVSNRPVQLTYDYPIEGRVFHANLEYRF